MSYFKLFRSLATSIFKFTKHRNKKIKIYQTFCIKLRRNLLLKLEKICILLLFLLYCIYFHQYMYIIFNNEKN